MTAVTGHARRLLRRLGGDDPARGGLEEILKGGERATLLTRQLLAFSRRQILRVEDLDLNAVIGDMASMLRRLLGEDIELIVQPAAEPAVVRADRTQIEQAVVNLAVNARDAMPEGGSLTVATAGVRLEDREELGRLDLPVGDYAMLSVTDTGRGMDAEAQAHVFEPFFTTKPPGEGTGLGLSTVYGIVKQSGGGIAFSSRVGHGAVFRIYLPRSAEPFRIPAAAKPAEPPAPAATAGSTEPRGDETVLLVEDEAIVRKLISLELEDAGYRVLQAESPGQALAVAQRHTGRIDLLLSDVILPGLSGPRLFEALAPLRPEAKILYISGHTEQHIVQRGVLDPGAAFLAKPFTPEALTGKIREVLGARRADAG
jgi:two-component system, cell cycle sensor histidine kinase and response regulator CckA